MRFSFFKIILLVSLNARKINLLLGFKVVLWAVTNIYKGDFYISTAQKKLNISSELYN